MLINAGKDFLAVHAGSANCYQPSGITFTDADGISHTGATGDVANGLYVAHLVGKDTVAITADGKNYNDFKAANGGNDMAIDDVGWVYDNDGGAGEPQYCLVAPTEALWHILQATDSVTGANIFASKVHVDGVYTGHYSPEDLTFCTGCKCDTVVDCGFGSHTVTVKATGYNDWTQTRTLAAGDVFSDTPVMVPVVAPTPTPTPTPTPVPLVKNLLENPNFEEGMKGWTVVATGPEDTPKIVSDVKYEGNNSMYFVDGAMIKSGFMPVTPGRRLRTSMYAKGENIVQGVDPSHRLHAYARWADADKNIFITPPFPSWSAGLGTFDWKKFEVVRDIPAEAAYYIITDVGVTGTATGKGWIDKLEVVMLPLKITFNSIPIGAEIIIDGVTTNRFTPETLEVAEGTHSIVLKKVGYNDFTQSITVTKDETFTWTLTLAPTPTPVPPIEIEVKRAELAGYVDIGKSTIPRRLKTTRKATFRMHVSNIGDFKTKYRVTLEFRGYKTFPFVSEFSDPCEPGKYKSVYLDVIMPDDAVPVDETVAYYDLFSVLEGEEVTV